VLFGFGQMPSFHTLFFCVIFFFLKKETKSDKVYIFFSQKLSFLFPFRISLFILQKSEFPSLRCFGVRIVHVHCPCDYCIIVCYSNQCLSFIVLFIICFVHPFFLDPGTRFIMPHKVLLSDPSRFMPSKLTRATCTRREGTRWVPPRRYH